ncbi:MAG TPA: phenylacetic acid degradation operon negative regulatory protein PaaX [Casimicrobiaceae bacterium]|nr:phenylacetic acid degradation operon negative regulatory protein PaaX [Casimicrobiaceae bacterium]
MPVSNRPTDDPAVARWVRRELAERPPRARSLIATIWGDTLAPHGGEVWLSTLIDLLAPFDINERLVRTSVFRLAKDGWLAAETRGRRSRYRLTRDGAQRFEHAYRRVYTPPLHRWDGAWNVVIARSSDVPSASRKPLRDALAWNGYAILVPGVYARPSTPGLVDDFAHVENRIVKFIARDIADSPTQSLANRVDQAWQLGELAADYREFIGRFARVVEAFHSERTASPRQAFVVRSLLVHEYRRVRLRDPQLPARLLPTHWPGAEAYSLCRDFYRTAIPLAEAHLANVVAANGETLRAAQPSLRMRFAAIV